MKKKMQQKKRMYTTAIMAFLMFSIVLASVPMANAVGALTLTPTTQTPGASVTVIGSGFGVQKPVGLGFGAEVNATNEDMKVTGPYDTGTGPYIGYVSHLPMKPGTYKKAINLSSTVWLAIDTDNGNGTFSASSAMFVSGTIDYVTGKVTLYLNTPLSSTTYYASRVNYTYYQYSVTPAAGVTTFATGTFQAAITVPSVFNGNHKVTAIDTKGNIATATLTVTGGLESYDWPMFRHDLQHTGYSTSPAPSTNLTLWNYTTGSFIASSPAVADGKVYIGSYDRKFYCLDAATGAHIWNFTTGGIVGSSPAVVDGRVYVGSDDDNIYCLDAASGALLWNYTTGGDVASSPAVSGGLVYMGSKDDRIYCRDASNGAHVWNRLLGGDVLSTPAVADGRVYVGSYDNKVYCFDSVTGASIWNYTTGGWVWSSPAVADGKVYVGSNDTKVYALNALSGALVWNYTTGAEVISSPAIADGKVYVGSYDNKTYCLNAATGAFIWSYTADDYFFSSPALADGKVYIGSYDDKVYCLNAATGSLIWSYTSGMHIVSSPAVANGLVYIGSVDRKVYAFSAGPPIPESLTIGVMMLLSAVAMIVGTRYFRKRPKTENFSQVKL